MRDAPVHIGDIVAGKYRVERVLGAGAMGMVVAATQIALDWRVALKFMIGGGAAGRQNEERFLREARAAGRLRSQHAAKVLDVGTLEDGAPYIVMEFLDGKDSAAVLAERGPLPVEEAVTYVLQVCEAVAEAHGAGIVHRDIKPANLFLTRGADGSPCVKLVDFGVAKLGDSGLELTATAETLGSPLYMSPEQINAPKTIDRRSDIWALGVTLYQLLAKVTPFHAETLMQLTTHIFLHPPTPLKYYRPEVLPALVAVIEQCLEKDRERRWPSVAALAAALAPHAPAQPASYTERLVKVPCGDIAPARATDLPPVEPTSARAQAAFAMSPAHLSASPATIESAGSQARPRILAVIGTTLAVGLSLALFFGLRPRGRDPKSNPPPPETMLATDAPPPRPDVSMVPESTSISIGAPAVTSAMPDATVSARASARTSPPGISPAASAGRSAANRTGPMRTVPAPAPTPADPFARDRK